ncbi:MAG: outer membrane protein assembly factor BamE [Rhodobacteraceae bacterium]|nr:outer membrane protein assembly factor BamE [Paracoccaceae bacterium]
MSIFLACATTACAIVDTHGYIPAESDLEEIEVGLDTQDTVEVIVGRPGSTGFLNQDGWYYIKSEFRRRGSTNWSETERQVVAILFDEQGVVQNVERYGLEDGQVVTLSRRVTDSNTAGVGLISQLLGNLTNFDPAQQF